MERYRQDGSNGHIGLGLVAHLVCVTSSFVGSSK